MDNSQQQQSITTTPGDLPTNGPPSLQQHGQNDNFLNVHVDVSSSSKCNEQVRYIIQQFCPFLLSVHLVIRPLTGGLSNHLFTVSSSSTTKGSTSTTSSNESPPKYVLVRIHPDGGCGGGTAAETGSNDGDATFNTSESFSLVDRSIENKVAVWLAQQGVAPRVFGRFVNGRVEEFYDNVEPLSSPLMKYYIPQIARSMADFHSLQAPSSVLPKLTSNKKSQQRCPRNDTPTMTMTTPNKKAVEAEDIICTTSSLFVTVDEWLKKAHELLEISSDDDDDSDGKTGGGFCEQSTASSNSASTSLLGPEESQNDDDEGDNDNDNDSYEQEEESSGANNHQSSTAPDSTSSCSLVLLNEMQREWKWLTDQLSKRPPQTKTESWDVVAVDPMEDLAYSFIRQVVVAHMDCQPLNILVDKADEGDDDEGKISSKNNEIIKHNERRIRLIDFEYAGWNARAADIANTFCEFCEMSNLRADYENEYPSAKQQDEYFRQYCKQSTMGADHQLLERFLARANTTRIRQEDAVDGQQDDEIESESESRMMEIKQFIEILQSPEDHPSSWDVISTALSREVGRFSLVSHLSWSIWSLLKAQEEDGVPDFDYVVYARHRMDGYAWGKDKFFP